LPAFAAHTATTIAIFTEQSRENRIPKKSEVKLKKIEKSNTPKKFPKQNYQKSVFTTQRISRASHIRHIPNKP
jgi:hypothetical protein